MSTLAPRIFRYPLRDGTEAAFRPVLPEDKWRLVEGLTRFSPRSRYFRFFSNLTEFTDAQLRYLTEVDQVDHVAWCALDPSTPNLIGMGLGRFARLPARPDAAEFSLTVLDEVQGKGIGSLLLAILYAAAERRAIHTLTALVLPDNDAMFAWLERLGGQVRLESTGYEIDLPVSPRSNAGPDWEHFAALVEHVRPWNP